MYSVFTKTITEPSAVDILRNYSNPNSPDFGDAQQIYADLCDHFEGGAIGQVTITELETLSNNTNILLTDDEGDQSYH
eukprot:scaffold11140_cov114-Amphora_coffeaeformis.AAC.2